MSQFNAQDSFAQGIGLGLQGLSLQQRRKEAEQQLMLAIQAAQQRQQYQDAQVGLGRDRLAQQGQYNEQRLATDRTTQRLRESQHFDKQMQEYATQQGNADIYGRNVLAPRAGADYFKSGHTDEDFFRTAEGLQGDRNAFAQMPSEAQKPVIADMFKAAEQERGVTARLDTAEMMKNAQLESIEMERVRSMPKDQANIDGHNRRFDRMREGVIAKFNPSQTVDANDYQHWPGIQNYPPETKRLAIEHVRTYGTPPPRAFFEQQIEQRNQQAEQARLVATASQQGYTIARQEYTLARQALAEFDKIEENRAAMTPPPPGAKTEALAAFNAVRQRRAPLVQALQQTDQRRKQALAAADAAQQAMINAAGTLGSPTQPGPDNPAAAPSTPAGTKPQSYQRPTPEQEDAIARQIAALYPNWEDDPEQEKALKDHINRALGIDPNHESEPDSDTDDSGVFDDEEIYA